MTRIQRNGSKLKPSTYNGSEDLDEYLTQFNIISELNQWDYYTKSLFLASSMTGPTRTLLCELDSAQRRDFNAIVGALQNRYGSLHKAELYRSKLQSKVLEKNESLPDLAQSVLKLTRKAYPTATSEVVELLALDFFIDAIPDTDIRLRLREVGPKTISEAERIAVRLEAHKTADKSRGKQHVRSVIPDNAQNKSELEKLTGQLSNLVKEMRCSQSSPKPFRREKPYNTNERTGYRYDGRGDRKFMDTQHNAFRYASNNQRQNFGNQENMQRSSSRTGPRLNFKGPTHNH